MVPMQIVYVPLTVQKLKSRQECQSENQLPRPGCVEGLLVAKCADRSATWERNFSTHFKLLMPGNQRFNHCLYAALTLAPLACRASISISEEGVYESQTNR